MASASYIKDVSPGFGEYFSDGDDLSQGEYVSFEFNNEITIDDIIVTSSIELASNDIIQIYFQYPSSGMKGVIATINASMGWTLNYFLNSTYDSIEGHQGTGRNWYRVPARTKLFVEAISLNGDNLNGTKLTVIGRGS